MQVNKVDDWPSNSFLTLLIVYSAVTMILEKVMYQGMFCMS